MRIPLLAGAYAGVSTNTSSQEAVNWYYEGPAPREGHSGAMVPVHGATLFDTLANTGDIRGMLFDPGDALLYVVSDNDLYSVNSGATETARDVLATSSGRIEMALNPLSREILTVDGNTGYHYDIPTTTATDISDADFPDTATTVAYINGRFLVNDPTVAGKIWWSNLNDGLTWDGTDNGTAQSLETPVQKILVDKNDIFLFGDYQTEVWYNSGSNLVFERFEWIETGIAAPGTAVKFDNSIAWLSQNSRGQLQAVRIGEGYNPVVFSTPELTRKWEAYGTVSDAFAYSYQFLGHEFYVLTFPTGNATWVYDAVTQEWHQRSGAFSGGEPTRELANAYAYTTWSGGTHIVGDYNVTGKLFAFDPDTYTFDSTNMERRLTGPLINVDNEDRLRFSEVQIDVEEGVIDAADSGNDRQLTLYYSKDGGHTYSSGVQLNIGEAAVDGYTHRLIKRKLGYGRLWNFRIYTDTPRKIVIKGAFGTIYHEPRNVEDKRNVEGRRELPTSL